MTDADVRTAIQSVFDGMRNTGPRAVMARIGLELEEAGTAAGEAEVVSAIVSADGNDPARKAVHFCLAHWDAERDASWIGDTPANSAERRDVIFTKLGLSAASRAALDAEFPCIAQRDDTVIDNPAPWDPWYTPERRAAHDFYWNAYRGVLDRGGWAPESVEALDTATTNIVQRLADPSSATSYQSKGLVVGYVQSGKTANFTGTVAKAIDAGYRLIIVLTGTIELLRGQTQRRLDKELIGEENILGGRDRTDPDAVRDVDYIGDGDQDWIDHKFVVHDVDFSRRRDIPGIKRLTTASGDYKLLKAGLDTLDFRRTGELQDVAKPLHDPVNLFGTDVRLAVVKKNKSVLTKLLRDLQDIHASLKEIPVLVIDDEADQASVNTTRPQNTSSAAVGKRTAINGLIRDILSSMPRSQYIGYTATPFANVFVSPDDAADIFPSDFIIALEPAPAYMGGKQFHDLEPLPDDEPHTAANSNEKAFVRDLYADGGEPERRELQTALDSFVLSGAIKLWRAAHDDSVSFRHHTMLVHQSVKTTEHQDLADLIRAVWSHSDYSGPGGFARLRSLYEKDYLPVHEARPWGTAMPDRLDGLKPYVGEALDLITRRGDPVVIVNGTKESDYKAMDFATGRYWRILVGGTKLSRGFTVEGLTVTYYRRRAMAADTLMQMGRWFGYRKGYRDLVRLFIARDVVVGKKSYDLYDAFTAIVQDEEEFRDQLRDFARVDENGRPEVRPIDVPPMVFQQLPWLKPTSAKKMYNAVLDVEGIGGKLRDFPRQVDHDPVVNREHFAAVEEWLGRLSDLLEFEYRERTVEGTPGAKKPFHGRVAIVDAEEMCEVLGHFHWTDGYSFAPTQRFMRRAIEKHALKDWVVLVPDLANVAYRDVAGHSLQLMRRTRRSRGGFSGSSFRQRGAIERIAGKREAHGGPQADALSTSTRGAMLLTFAGDTRSGAMPAEGTVDPGDVATLFSLALPLKSAPRGRIGFRVRDESRKDDVIIDAV